MDVHAPVCCCLLCTLLPYISSDFNILFKEGEQDKIIGLSDVVHLISFKFELVIGARLCILIILSGNVFSKWNEKLLQQV